MNSKHPVPDELIMFDRQFSWRTAWKVCRWWFVAFVISTVFDLIFPDVKNQLSVGWRSLIVFAEFLAILLFTHDAAKFIRKMDELQRRITVAALFFSVGASFFCLCALAPAGARRFFQRCFWPANFRK